VESLRRQKRQRRAPKLISSVPRANAVLTADHTKSSSSTLFQAPRARRARNCNTVDSHRATTYFVGPYVKQHAVLSTRYSQTNLLRAIEDILGTEHINLNTYYARPMADVFDITSSGSWTFNAVASTLLKPTTLGLDPTKVEFASGRNLKPTHNAQYWAAKTRGFEFSAEDRVPADLYNKILWVGLKGKAAPVAKTRFLKVDADDKDKDGK
jgi:hypothetical protein